MNKINVKKMVLKNFKGIKELEVNFSEKTEIRGANATGKTTVCDAFSWLLFGKDSQGSTNFNIKTLDVEGNVIHNLDHLVECELEVNGVIKTLKKVYNEKWTRKKGDENTELTGHETSCFINEVPYKINEFKKEIKDIVDEDIFKILSNPLNFEKLDWKKKREILLKICGNVDEESIFLLDEFKGFEEELNGRTLEQYKDVLNGQIRAFNNEIKDIPKRIDENRLKIKEVEETKDFLETELKDLEIKEKVLNGKLNSGNDSQALDIKKEILELEEKENEIFKEENNKMKNEISVIELEIDKNKKDLKEIDNSIEKNNKKIKDLENENSVFSKDLIVKNQDIIKKRKEVVELKSKEIINFACPVCKGKGEVTAEQLENNRNGFVIDSEALKEAKETFNLEKSNKLIKLTGEGVAIKTDIENLEKFINENLSSIEKTKETLKNNEELYKKSESLIEECKEKIKEIEKIFDKNTNERKEKLEKIKSEKLEKIKNSNFSEEKENVKKELEKIEQDKKNINEKLFILKNNEEILKRNSELEEELKSISSKFLACEKNIFKVEKFTKYKVELLEKKVADNFKNVGFKLFVEQVNGGLADTCETTVEGVPYSDVNTAGKINAGIDIINTLSKFYEVIVPLFIDNRESIVEIIDTNSQVVNLVVDKNFKKLEIKGE